MVAASAIAVWVMGEIGLDASVSTVVFRDEAKRVVDVVTVESDEMVLADRVVFEVVARRSEARRAVMVVESGVVIVRESKAMRRESVMSIDPIKRDRMREPAIDVESVRAMDAVEMSRCVRHAAGIIRMVMINRSFEMVFFMGFASIYGYFIGILTQN